MKAFIQLGKIGDVLSILPILHQKHLKTGEKPILVIGREYASILEGVSYVEPCLWKGEVSDLAGAILFAKKRFSKVIVLQTHAKNIRIEQTTPSFQLDQWRRAGCVEHFYDWPLVFDRRDQTREPLSLTGQPYILFGDHSQSSPFLHKEELADMLKKEFPNHQIWRLSEVRTERFFELLGLFDEAAALVTVETAHIHLSKASRVPTFVLAANGWRGSAWHPGFKLHMRYGAWERRKWRLIEAVSRAVAGEPEPFKTECGPTAFPDGYNPSILDFGGQIVSSYRYHDRNDWRTALAFDNGTGAVKLEAGTALRNYSLEDARLFVLGGRLHAAYVVSTEIDRTFRSYVAYGEIADGRIGHVHVRYNGNDFSGLTKNWTPFIHDGTLHFIYGIQGKTQTVLRVDGDKVQAEYSSPAATWEWGEIRGGAIVAHEGKLVRLFHSRVGEHATGKYFIGAALMEAQPPFATLKVSRRAIIEGDERWTPDCSHWKANVAICYGAVKVADKFLLSYGRNDCECCVAELAWRDLHL